ncbi:hypothetical protein ACN469_20110 [Corallococcus terminator]
MDSAPFKRTETDSVICAEFGTARKTDPAGQGVEESLAPTEDRIADATTRAKRTLGVLEFLVAFRPERERTTLPSRTRRLDHASSAPNV